MLVRLPNYGHQLTSHHFSYGVCPLYAYAYNVSSTQSIYRNIITASYAARRIVAQRSISYLRASPFVRQTGVVMVVAVPKQNDGKSKAATMVAKRQKEKKVFLPRDSLDYQGRNKPRLAALPSTPGHDRFCRCSFFCILAGSPRQPTQMARKMLRAKTDSTTQCYDVPELFRFYFDDLSISVHNRAMKEGVTWEQARDRELGVRKQEILDDAMKKAAYRAAMSLVSRLLPPADHEEVYQLNAVEVLTRANAGMKSGASRSAKTATPGGAQSSAATPRNRNLAVS